MGKAAAFSSGERGAALDQWPWEWLRGRDPPRERPPPERGKSSGWHCNAIHIQEGSAQPQEKSAPQGVGRENHWPEVWDALQ